MNQHQIIMPSEVVANCEHFARLRFSPNLPYVFAEHGALMLGNVLKSSRAVEVSLIVVRAFAQLREILSTHKELVAKLLKHSSINPKTTLIIAI